MQVRTYCKSEFVRATLKPFERIIVAYANGAENRG